MAGMAGKRRSKRILDVHARGDKIGCVSCHNSCVPCQGLGSNHQVGSGMPDPGRQLAPYPRILRRNRKQPVAEQGDCAVQSDMQIFGELRVGFFLQVNAALNLAEGDHAQNQVPFRLFASQAATFGARSGRRTAEITFVSIRYIKF